MLTSGDRTRGGLRDLPPSFVERALAFAAGGEVAAPARPAATVLLLRDDPLRVFLIRRAATMVFAGGLYAFPGGRAEDGDADIAATAIRELREETGVSDVEITAWSRWITPEFEPRRYDTWFFVGALPAGTEAENLGTEADRALWLTPAEALERHRASMLPPTAVTLDELSTFDTVEQVLIAAAGRDLAPVMPKVVLDDGRPRMAIPGDPDYPELS